MTPGQRHRLEAVAAAIQPCLGCLQEDIFAAADERDEIGMFERLRDKIRSVANEQRVKNGEEPLPEPSEEERQQDRQEGQRRREQAIATLSQLEGQKRRLLRSVRPSKRRTSCPSCTQRRRSREACTRLAQRVSQSRRNRAAEDALDGPFDE